MLIGRGHLFQAVRVLGVVSLMIARIIYYPKNDDRYFSVPGHVNTTVLSILSCVMLRPTELAS